MRKKLLPFFQDLYFSGVRPVKLKEEFAALLCISPFLSCTRNYNPATLKSTCRNQLSII